MDLFKILNVVSVILLFFPVVYAISNVESHVDGNKVTLTYEGNPPFLVNIRGDKNIGSDGGYVWANTNSKTFTIDMGFADNPPTIFYYGVKDTAWSEVHSFTLGDNAEQHGEMLPQIITVRNISSYVNSKGYIIKLRGAPLIQKQTELRNSESKVAAQRDILSYKSAVESEHAEALKHIDSVATSSKVLTEFFNTFNGLTLEMPPADLNQLKNIPEIESIYPNLEVKALLMDSVPLIHADDVWQMQDRYSQNITGVGTKIAIIDTGVDYIHHDLGGCFGPSCKVVGGYDYVNNDSDPMDDHGHGTHVAGIAAGLEFNPRGELDLTSFNKTYGFLYGDFVYLRDRKSVELFNESGRCVYIPNFPNAFCLTIANISVHEQTPTSITIAYGVRNDMPIDFDTANFDFRVIADSFNPTPLFVQGYAFYGTYYNMTFDKRLIPAGENSIIYINWSTTPLITRALGGVAPGADIFAYKVLDSGGVGYFSDIIKAIDDSVDLDGDGIPAEDDEDMVDIISMSLGGMGSPDSPESEAISNVFEAGVVVVVAAGNSGPYHFSVGSPGSSDKALTVGAVYKKDYVGDYWGDIDPRRDQITSFSSRGPVASGAVKPDVVAPGAIICSAEYDSAWSDRRCYDGAHVEISGTSMATPHVAGLAALAKQAHPSWSPQDIKNTIRATAIDLGDWTTDQGLGRVDAFGSVQTTPPFPTAIIDSSYQNLDLLQDNQFEVEGTAEGLLFDSYALSYADGIDSEDWIPVYSSTSPVINGVLGHISANVTEGVIKVKLTVQDQTGQESSDTAIRIQRDDFDVSAHPGWPRQLHKDLFEGFMFVGAIFACANNGIKVADLDGDGRNEIITTNMGSPGKLYVFRDDGTLFWQKNSTSFVCSTPAIGNIDADPELEIMYKANFPLWDDSLGFSDHVIQAWNHDGSVVPGWPVDTLGEIAPLDSPSLADMDNDGIDEIIVQRSRKLEVIDGKGSTIWAVGNDQGFAMGAPVVVDLNHDGKIDVLQSNIVDQIYAYDNGGDELWRVTGCNPPVQGTLAAAKTKDGRVFISAGTCILNSTGNILFNTFGQTIFGNIDTDTDPEIVSYDWGRIATYELDGTKIGEYLIPLGDWLNPVSPLSYQPVIGDMDNDGLNDIVSFSRTGNILIFNASANLTQVIKSFNNLDLISVSVESAYPSLYDIDNDGKLELLHIMEFEAGSYLFVSNIPGSGNHVEWGTYQHDNKNTGCYNCVLSCRPGQIIGDVDDDGSVTAEDQNLVGNVVAGTIQPPSNICCIDATQDREVNVGDITRIGRIATGLDPSPGVCENVLNCHVGQLIGDLNGNGEVTKDDQFLAAELVAGNIPLPDDICCADANIDRKISVGDVTKIGRIVAGLDPSTGLCS